MQQSLNNIQNWFQTVITHPDGVTSGIASSAASNLIDVVPDEIEKLILPSLNMSSIERMQIYGAAYYGRLVECLRAQFPAVRHAAGEQAFDGFAFSYLTQYPSTNYSLSHLGQSFDAYLAATRPPRRTNIDEPDFADFLVDLARLERVYGEVFDGPGSETSVPMRSADFEGLTIEAFAAGRLVFYGCVQLMEIRFPVHEYASAIRRATEPIIPSPRTTFLVITRRDYIVRRFEITRDQFQLLTYLQQNLSVGEALAKLFENQKIDFSSLHHEIKIWFEEWTAARLFAGFDIESEP